MRTPTTFCFSWKRVYKWMKLQGCLSFCESGVHFSHFGDSCNASMHSFCHEGKAMASEWMLTWYVGYMRENILTVSSGKQLQMSSSHLQQRSWLSRTLDQANNASMLMQCQVWSRKYYSCWRSWYQNKDNSWQSEKKMALNYFVSEGYKNICVINFF